MYGFSFLQVAFGLTPSENAIQPSGIFQIVFSFFLLRIYEGLIQARFKSSLLRENVYGNERFDGLTLTLKLLSSEIFMESVMKASQTISTSVA